MVQCLPRRERFRLADCQVGPQDCGKSEIRTGLTQRRPQYATFPEDTRGFAIDNQYYLGREGLITKPVTAPGVDTSTVYLSDNQASPPRVEDTGHG